MSLHKFIKSLQLFRLSLVLSLPLSFLVLFSIYPYPAQSCFLSTLILLSLVFLSTLIPLSLVLSLPLSPLNLFSLSFLNPLNLVFYLPLSRLVLFSIYPYPT
jgi:hypothetical protein